MKLADKDANQSRVVLGIIRRRPVKSIPTPDFDRLIRLCDNLIETDQDTADIRTLRLRLIGERDIRIRGHKRFEPKASNLYSALEVPAKAIQAVQVMAKIFAEPEKHLTNVSSDSIALFQVTTEMAVTAFESRKKAAYLPKVYRALIVSVAKSLKDPVAAVKAFVENDEYVKALDAAWSAPVSEAEPEKESEVQPARQIRIVVEGDWTKVIHPGERLAGKRAAFHVHREVDGEKNFEPSYANTPDDAANEVLAAYSAINKPVRIYAIVKCSTEYKSAREQL